MRVARWPRISTHFSTQYFISGLSNSGPVNKVAEALANRIVRAVKEHQVFKLVVVLPVLPDPGPLTWPGRAVTRLCVRFVVQDGRCIRYNRSVLFFLPPGTLTPFGTRKRPFSLNSLRMEVNQAS